MSPSLLTTWQCGHMGLSGHVTECPLLWVTVPAQEIRTTLPSPTPSEERPHQHGQNSNTCLLLTMQTKPRIESLRKLRQEDYCEVVARLCYKFYVSLS